MIIMSNPFMSIASYFKHHISVWLSDPRWLEDVSTYVHYDVSQETIEELEKILEEYRKKIEKKKTP